MNYGVIANGVLNTAEAVRAMCDLTALRLWETRAHPHPVIPVEAGIQAQSATWTPAFAGVTNESAGDFPG